MSSSSGGVGDSVNAASFLVSRSIICCSKLIPVPCFFCLLFFFFCVEVNEIEGGDEISSSVHRFCSDD